MNKSRHLVFSFPHSGSPLWAFGALEVDPGYDLPPLNQESNGSYAETEGGDREGAVDLCNLGYVFALPSPPK